MRKTACAAFAASSRGLGRLGTTRSGGLVVPRRMMRPPERQAGTASVAAQGGAVAAGPVDTSAFPSPPPVLLLDVMDTIVYDPFYLDMPRFFGITFKELLAAKHPSAWIQVRCGLVAPTSPGS